MELELPNYSGVDTHTAGDNSNRGKKLDAQNVGRSI